MDKSGNIQAMVQELKQLKVQIEREEQLGPCVSHSREVPGLLLNTSSFMQLKDDYLP